VDFLAFSACHITSDFLAFSAGCPGEFMMWCPLMLMLARDANMEDVGVLQVDFNSRKYSFIFTDGHYSLDNQDAMIAWLTTLLQMTLIDYGTAASADLQIEGLEFQKESTGVNVNTFLIKREC
jgi:hypothetical protein